MNPICEQQTGSLFSPPSESASTTDLIMQNPIMKSFSSFKPVSPLNQRVTGTTNIIMKPMPQKSPTISATQTPLQQTTKTPTLIQAELKNQDSLFSSSTSSPSSMDQEKENQLQKQYNTVAIQNMIHRTQPPIQSAQQGNSLEEQLLQELQRTIQQELQQSQGNGDSQLSMLVHSLASKMNTTKQPTINSNENSTTLDPSLESIGKYLKQKNYKSDRSQQYNERYSQSYLHEEVDQELPPSLMKRTKLQDSSEKVISHKYRYHQQEESDEYYEYQQMKRSMIKNSTQRYSYYDNSNSKKSTISQEEYHQERLHSMKVSPSTNDQSSENKARVCNCKKTKCLKLYCDCFASGEFCGIGCNCTECSNTISNRFARNKIVENLLEKNPFTFCQTEIEPEDLSQLTLKEQKKLASRKGCNCRRSGCQKKYCQCYQEGQQCNEHCKCSGCENCEKPQYTTSNQKLKSQMALSISTSPGSSVETVPLIACQKNIPNISQNKQMIEEKANKTVITQAIQAAVPNLQAKQSKLSGVQSQDSLEAQESTEVLLTSLLASVFNSNSQTGNNPLVKLATLQASLQKAQRQKLVSLQISKQEQENSIQLEKAFFQDLQGKSELSGKAITASNSKQNRIN